MKKIKKDFVKKIISGIFIVGIAALLVFLVTWSPKPQDDLYTSYTVTTTDIERSSTDQGVVTTQVIDNEEKKVVQVFIDEYDVVNLEQDQEVTINALALDEEVQGSVYSVSDQPRITGDTTEYEVIVTFDSIPEDVRNGMHADVTIVLDQVEDVVAVPNKSLYQKDGQYYVDLLHEERRVYLKRLGVDRSTQVLEPIEVTIGFEGDEYTEITDGVEEGDEIAAE